MSNIVEDKIVINFSSSDRTNGTPSDFQINFGSSSLPQNPKSMSVLSMEYPFTVYNVNSTNNNLTCELVNQYGSEYNLLSTDEKLTSLKLKFKVVYVLDGQTFQNEHALHIMNILKHTKPSYYYWHKQENQYLMIMSMSK